MKDRSIVNENRTIVMKNVSIDDNKGTIVNENRTIVNNFV